MMMINLFEHVPMKKIIIIALVFTSLSAVAQKKWTLQECVNHALENNITVKQGENTLLINEQDVKESKGNFLPSVTGNAGHTLSLGNRELFPGQFVDRTDNSTFFSVGANQTIFNGFRNLSLRQQAELTLESNQLELDRIRDDISLNVVNAYLNVLFNRENLETAKAQVELSKKQLEQVKELVDAGVQPRANINDSEATLATDEQSLTVAENNFDLALLSLSQLLQVPFTGFDVEIVNLDDPSSALMYEDVSPILDFAFENRNEIKVAEMNIETAKASTKLSRSGFYPTVTGGYTFGTNVFYSNLLDTEDTFFNQLNDQKSHRFSLNVNVPIFSRNQNKTAVAKAKIREENSKLELERAKLNLESTIQRAFTDAKAAYRTYEASKKSLEAQQLAFQNSSERYNIGTMNAFDLELARIRLINAQASLINAKYDFVFKTKVLDFYMGKPITTN